MVEELDLALVAPFTHCPAVDEVDAVGVQLHGVILERALHQPALVAVMVKIEHRQILVHEAADAILETHPGGEITVRVEENLLCQIRPQRQHAFQAKGVECGEWAVLFVMAVCQCVCVFDEADVVANERQSHIAGDATQVFIVWLQHVVSECVARSGQLVWHGAKPPGIGGMILYFDTDRINMI